MKLTLQYVLLTFLLANSACSFKDNAKNSESPSPRKRILLAMNDDVKSADPATANDVVSSELIGHIFEGLLGFSYLGNMGTWEPVLAESVPQVSPTQKSFVFKLKKGVLFQDDPAFPGGKGREVVAEDFVYSFKRMGDPRLSSPNVWMLEGVIEGFQNWKLEMEASSPDKRDELFQRPIKGLTAVDKHTLKIDLVEPNPQFFSILSMNHTTVVAREVVEKYGPEMAIHPVGTGAFRLKEWIKGSKIVIEKNPSYHGSNYPSEGSALAKSRNLLKDAGKALPIVDEISWDIIKEEQPRWLKFMNGELDETTLPKDHFSEAIGADGELKPELSARGFKLHKAMSLTSWWIEFNMKDPILGKNPKLRKALGYAFDRARGLNLLYNNRGMLADAPFPPVLDNLVQIKPFPYSLNLDKARALLSEAGYPGGKGLQPLVFDLRAPGTTPRQLGELIADNFSKIGVKVQIMANSFPEALEKLRTSRFQMILGGWAGDYPDPENFLQNFYSENAAPGPNSSNFMNKEYDSLYREIRPLTPSPLRSQKISRMVEILTEEAPVVYFFHSMDYRLSNSRLLNFQPNLLLYGIGKYLDVAESQKP
jgi:oligopeptide transport system substrate-binding protein